jgi:hypothetical protein
MIEFEADLEPMGPAAAFVLSDEQVAEVGAGKKVFPVRVTAGDYAFAGRLARMGGKNLIGLSRAVREAGGLEIGARYAVRVELDTAERTVDVPDALASALDGAGLRERFDALSFTNRKELARSVAEAKREETRERRLAKILEQLGADRA